MAIKTDDFSYIQELNWIKRVARNFIDENTCKCDWDGNSVSIFTEDIVDAVLQDEDYLEFPEHRVSKDEIYDICEDMFLHCNEVWNPETDMCLIRRFV